VTLLGELAQIEVATAEVQGHCDSPLLVFQAGAGQVEVQPVATGLLGVDRDEAKTHLCVVSGQQGTAGFVDDLSIEQAAPERSQFCRIVGIKGDCHEC
jgi:hypothetical protein